jgi:hypothetical protein
MSLFLLDVVAGSNSKNSIKELFEKYGRIQRITMLGNDSDQYEHWWIEFVDQRDTIKALRSFDQSWYKLVYIDVGPNAILVNFKGISHEKMEKTYTRFGPITELYHVVDGKWIIEFATPEQADAYSSHLNINMNHRGFRLVHTKLTVSSTDVIPEAVKEFKNYLTSLKGDPIGNAEKLGEHLCVPRGVALALIDSHQ